MRTPLLAATSLLAALTWTVALVVDQGPFDTIPALLIGVGLLIMATVATVGMIVIGSRWSHRLGLVTTGFTTAIAVVRDVDPVWFVATGITALATIALLSPTLASSIRRLPAATGPPPRAILPPLLLVATPCLLGFVGNDSSGWALATVGLSAPMVAFLYSRVLPGGLLGIRVIWPTVAVGLAPFLGWLAGLLSTTLGLMVAVIGWGTAVKASYHPPRAVGTGYPIPSELTPPEVLEAAEIDEKGRSR